MSTTRDRSLLTIIGVGRQSRPSASVIAALGAAALIMGGAYSVRSFIEKTPQISVNLNSLAWWSAARFALEQVDAPGQDQIFLQASEILPEPVAAAVPAKPVHAAKRVIFKKQRPIVRRAPKLPVVSAPAIEKETQVIVAAAAPQPEFASESEILSMQDIHAALKRQMTIAMNMPLEAILISHAAVDDVPLLPAVNTQVVVAKQRVRKARSVRSRHVARVLPPLPADVGAREIPADAAAEEPQIEVTLNVPEAIRNRGPEALLKNPVRVNQDSLNADYSPEDALALLESERQTQDPVIKEEATPESAEYSAMAEDEVAQGSQAPPDQPEGAAKFETATPGGLIRPAQAVSAVSEVSTQGVVTQDSQTVTTQSSASGPLAVEAFDRSTAVSSIQQSVFSHEGVAQRTAARWMVTASPGYLSTLALIQKQIPASAVEMISSNTALLLSKLTQTRIENEMGIVFGRIPVGHTVELVGRSEKPLYIDSKQAGERYFALVNTAPGGHLLHVRQEVGGTLGSVAIPVIEGIATYLDLSQPKRIELAGTLLDASRVDATPVRYATVRVVGQGIQDLTTDTSGAFSFREVAVFGAHPVYFEAETKTGFKHRYKLAPVLDTKLQLFHFPSRQIYNWVGQLEGGVSSESGLIIAGFYGSNDTANAPKLQPVVTPFSSSANLLPESYTLSSSDQMLVAKNLDPLSPRFASVQVPQGFNLVKLKDDQKRTHWSDLLMASPGVINVVGPAGLY